MEDAGAEKRSVNQFDILAKIGEGGMGRVYKARDRRLDRIVALKFLTSALLESEHAHSRFQREARALSALSHQHIGTIFDVAESAGEPFLVLEYLGGRTLYARLRRLRTEGQRLPASRILSYAVQMAQGLAHAHRHGIVHRDVKTSNVLFDGEGSRCYWVNETGTLVRGQSEARALVESTDSGAPRRGQPFTSKMVIGTGYCSRRLSCGGESTSPGRWFSFRTIPAERVKSHGPTTCFKYIQPILLG